MSTTNSPSRGEGLEAALKAAGVWVEGVSTNYEHLLIKVKDLGSSFEYEIYDAAKLRQNIKSLLSSQRDTLVEGLLALKKTPSKHDTCTLDDMYCYDHSEIMEESDYPNGAYHFNLSIDAAIKLIKETGVK